MILVPFYLEHRADGDCAVPVSFERPYTPDKRRYAVALWRCMHLERSTAAISRLLHIPRTTLRRWVAQS